MSIFSLSKNKDELVLVFDIGSSSVKAALFYMQNSGVPKIILTAREAIIIEDQISFDRFFAATIKALDLVTKKVYKESLGAPHRIFCIFSSPWHHSQSRVISLQKNTPFVLTSKIIDDLINKEVILIKKEFLDKYEHIENSLRIIELKNIKITLNGYETAQPLSKKVKEVEMTIHISLSEEKVCKKIEDTISKYFHFKEMKFSAFSIAAFTVVRDIFTSQGNFLLVNIGGEITDISMVKKNTLSESTSFPLGINFMIRAISNKVKCSLSEAKSLLSLFKDGHATEATSVKLEPIINELKSQWLVQFQESLSNLSNDISIPAFVYITIDKDLADFFTEIIKTEQFNQYTLTESKFQIVFLNIENLHSIATFEQKSIFNAFLAIDTVYINRFLK